MSLSGFLLGNVTSASYSGLTLQVCVSNEKLGKDIGTMSQVIIGVFALMVPGVLVVDLKKHLDPVQTFP